MNDREKMLADLREAFDDVFTGDLENAKHFVVRYRDKLEALLTEPTLEEVLAELGEHGFVHFDNANGVCFCWVTGRDSGWTIYQAEAATPLQAASECLRGVKE